MHPVAETSNPLTIGFFSMQPEESFDFVYDVVEYKVVTKGKFVIRDKEGNRYVAEAGDVILFLPDFPVIFDGESDGGQSTRNMQLLFQHL
jgi:ethanolamine utilization protein EutQ (cupin superfamily)